MAQTRRCSSSDLLHRSLVCILLAASSTCTSDLINFKRRTSYHPITGFLSTDRIPASFSYSIRRSLSIRDPPNQTGHTRSARFRSKKRRDLNPIRIATSSCSTRASPFTAPAQLANAIQSNVSSRALQRVEAGSGPRSRVEPAVAKRPGQF